MSILKLSSTKFCISIQLFANNLFNKNYTGTIDGITYTNGYAEGYALDPSNGDIIEMSDRYLSYPVPVQGEKTVYFKYGNSQILVNVLFAAWYDKEMNCIGVSNIFVNTIVLPANARFIRFYDTGGFFTNAYPTISYKSTEGLPYKAYSEAYITADKAVQTAQAALVTGTENSQAIRSIIGAVEFIIGENLWNPDTAVQNSDLDPSGNVISGSVFFKSSVFLFSA